MLIYSKADFSKDPMSINLIAAPTEIAVYQTDLCICVQEQQRVMFTRLSESPESTIMKSTRTIRNIIFGADFFLYNDAENKILSW